MAFICEFCKLSFVNPWLLQKHSQLHCELCGKLFINVGSMKEHVSQCNVYCASCNEYVPKKYFSYHKRTNAHRSKETTICLSEKVKLRKSDFNERIETYTYTNEQSSVMYPEEFFDEARDVIINILKESLDKHITIKFNMELECDYIKFLSTNDSGETQQNMSINHITKMHLITMSDNLKELYDMHAKDICTKMSEFQERDSGWSLIHMNCVNININQTTVFKGSSYLPLPQGLRRSYHTFLNIKNHDEYCFKWCIIAYLLRDSTATMNQLQNPQTYNIDNISLDMIELNNTTLDFSRMVFPVKLKDINIFEKNNDISVNVFGYDNGEIVGPYYLTREEKRIHINLLFITNEERSHYILIKDMSR